MAERSSPGRESLTSSDDECLCCYNVAAPSETVHKLPEWVNEGLHFWKVGYTGDQICISKRKNGKVKTYSCNPSEVTRGYDAEGKHRTCHARLYKAVVGVYPDKSCFGTWFGWSLTNGSPNFYSCTLNCPDGYLANRQSDGMIKESLVDMVNPQEFQLLVDSFTGCLHDENSERSFKETFQTQFNRARKIAEREVDHATMALKAAAKLRVEFCHTMSVEDLQNRCMAFVWAATGMTKRLFDVLDEADLDVHVQDDSCKSLLWIGAENGQTETVVGLTKAGADVNSRDKGGVSPIWMASRNGYTETVVELVKAGSDVNSQNDEGVSPIFMAAQNGRKETVVRNGYTEIVVELVKAGGVVNLQDKNGQSPIHVAAEYGRTETVVELVQAGGVVTVPDNNGVSPIAIAAQNGHTATVEALQNLL